RVLHVPDAAVGQPVLSLQVERGAQSIVPDGSPKVRRVGRDLVDQLFRDGLGDVVPGALAQPGGRGKDPGGGGVLAGRRQAGIDGGRHGKTDRRSAWLTTRLQVVVHRRDVGARRLENDRSLTRTARVAIPGAPVRELRDRHQELVAAYL